MVSNCRDHFVLLFMTELFTMTEPQHFLYHKEFLNLLYIRSRSRSAAFYIQIGENAFFFVCTRWMEEEKGREGRRVLFSELINLEAQILADSSSFFRKKDRPKKRWMVDAVLVLLPLSPLINLRNARRCRFFFSFPEDQKPKWNRFNW